MYVSLVGSGNVATHLANRLYSRGVRIKEVCNPNLQSAQTLSEQVKADPKADLDLSATQAQVVILCVPDRRISAIARSVKVPPGVIVAHTAGSVELQALGRSTSTAVVYPLQTFSMKRGLDFSQVPILIEASDSKTDKLIRELAAKLSDRVITMDSEKRQRVHVAAVFASNFVNHLLGVAQKIIRDIDADPELLKPLALETVSKAMDWGAARAQTGPASRNDQQVLEDHLRILRSAFPSACDLYEMHSNLIMEQGKP